MNTHATHSVRAQPHSATPALVPALDPDFHPAALAVRAFRAALGTQSIPIHLALERGDGGVSRWETLLAAPGSAQESANFFQLERLLKFLLWSRGGWKVYFHGPQALGRQLQAYYRDTLTGQFDAELMGRRIYEKPFEVCLADHLSDLPPAHESSAPLGRHLEGCRIGFDLGASDRKVAAMIDGQTVFSDETVWDPRAQKDPQWHFDQVMDSLRRAAAHLPRVDAIGGSSAGVYVHNRVRVASLFRGVPENLMGRVHGLFQEIQRAWNGVPMEVVNDGEVTALAGAMALSDSAVLGIALGSSQAVGYVTAEGNITPWLNELAFAPVDYNPNAPLDEWSGDRGCGVQYFSQQCVGRLMGKAGLPVDPACSLPEKLVQVQHLMKTGDERAARIYDTIGTYLGYSVAHYAEFYSIRHLLILGRVTTGPGGDIILNQARRVLAQEFPELAEVISFHVPDEKQKRHGQAMAAASLPVIPR